MIILPSKRAHRQAKQDLEQRATLWPDLEPVEVWNRKTKKGYTTIPRILPLAMRIIDERTNRQPCSNTYFELWCRANDQGVAQLHGRTDEIAYASRFGGSRGIATWEARLKELEKLGFVRLAPGGGRKNGFAVILNPYHVIYRLRQEGKVNDLDWNTINNRASTIKANDFLEAKSLAEEAPLEKPKLKKAKPKVRVPAKKAFKKPKP